MYFRPNYCANCGEKIERTDWGILTSRRFCPVCESEYKGTDLIPRVIVGLGLLIGLFGIGSYLRSGPEMPKGRASADQPRQLANLSHRVGNQARPEEPGTNIAAADVKAQTLPPVEKRSSDIAVSPPASVARPPVVESKYFCGAETKKGTPCSRRVKGNVRCFQHQGMPAILSEEKLRIN